MKITRVEIQAFRIYDKLADSTFDFVTDHGEVADFVSIYAPNGYGKTSFFEAIEWAFTNRIRRLKKIDERMVAIDKDQINRNIQSVGGRDILRNKKSSQHPTFVRVTDDSGQDFYNAIVNRPKKNQTDLDLGTRGSKPEFGYIQKILLQQDWIDTFLQLTDPTARYKEWEANVGEGRDATYFTTVYNLERLNREKIDQAKKKIDTLTASIGAEMGPKLSPINKAISRANSFGFELDPLDETFDQEKWLEFDAGIKSLISDLENELTSRQTRVTNLTAAISGSAELIGIAKFLEAPELVSRLNEARQRLEAITNVLDGIRTDEACLTDLREQAIKAAIKVDELTELSKTFAVYSTTLNLINEIEAKYASDLTERDRLTRLTLGLRETVGKSDNALADHTTRLSRQTTRLEEYPKIVSEIDRLEKDRAAILSEKTKIESDLSHLSSEDLSDILGRQTLLDQELSSVDGKDYFPRKHVPLAIRKEFRTATKAIVDLEAEIQKVTGEIADRSKYHSDIEKLVAAGLRIVHDSHQTDCPLCRADYNSFNSLVLRLNDNPGVTAELSSMTDDLSTKQTKLKAEKSSLQAIKTRFKGQLTAERRLLEDRFIIHSNSINDAQVRLAALEKQITDISNRILAQNTIFLGVEPSKYKKNLEREITDIRQSSKREARRHSELSKELELANAELDSVRFRIAGSTQQIDELRSAPAYIQFITLAGKYSMAVPVSQSEIKESLSGAKDERTSLDNRIKDLSKEIEKKRKTIIGETDAGVAVKINSLETEISEIERSRSYFRYFLHSELKIDIESKPISDESLADLLKREAESTIVGNAKLRAINKVASFEKLLKEVVEIQGLRADLNRLKASVRRQEKLRGILATEVNLVRARLESDVNQFFKQDLINMLYRSIDPHPDYDNIEFQCRFEDRNPMLDVLVTSSDGTQKAVPNLYFSAAQINVLSLSIFLARALETLDHNNEPVGFIFVDDPVQAMDSINVLSTIDLIRSIVVSGNKQVVLATHDENFHHLLRRKMPPDRFRAKYLELEAFGKVKESRF